MKSIAEFLNGQMERSEVLVVEAKMYESDGLRVVAPTLFGYTEEARRIKEGGRPIRGRKVWDEDGFFADARRCLGDAELEELRRFYEWVRSEPVGLRWGTGVNHGSFNVSVPGVTPRSALTATSPGRLYFNFGYLQGEGAEGLRADLAGVVTALFGSSLSADFERKYPGFPPAEWLPRVDDLIDRLGPVFEKHSAAGDRDGPSSGHRIA